MGDDLLYELIRVVHHGWCPDCLPGESCPHDDQATTEVDLSVAFAVLDWLGGLDPDADRDLIDDQATTIERLRGALIRVNEQRLYAERLVGSLPLDVGEHFERRRQETNELVRRVLNGEDS